MVLIASARVSDRDMGLVLVSTEELCAAASGITRSLPSLIQT
jgi:hypothetical protein